MFELLNISNGLKIVFDNFRISHDRQCNKFTALISKYYI